MYNRHFRLGDSMLLRSLPADGSWSKPMGTKKQRYYNNLKYEHPALIERREGHNGPKGGYRVDYRLTALGMDIAKSLFMGLEMN